MSADSWGAPTPSQGEPSEKLVPFSPGSDSSFNSSNKLPSREKGLFKGLCQLPGNYEIHDITNAAAEPMIIWHNPGIYTVTGPLPPTEEKSVCVCATLQMIPRFLSLRKGVNIYRMVSELNSVSRKLCRIFFINGSRSGNSRVFLYVIWSTIKTFDLQDFSLVIWVSLPVLNIHD